MGDAAAITNLLYRYAELIDAADFDGLGELLAHCTLRDGESGTVLATGREAIRDFFAGTVIVHADGTLRTKHVTTNPIVEIEGDEARVCSMYTVLQATDSLRLQAIIAGRYHDRFVRGPDGWRFSERRYFADLIGDLRAHLKMPLGIDDRSAGYSSGGDDGGNGGGDGSGAGGDNGGGDGSHRGGPARD